MHKTKPARVADRWLAELARRASLQVYPPGVTLLRQGAVARDIYAVQHGLVKLTHNAHNGRECVFGLRTAGDWLGEAAALLREAAPCSALTLTECELYRLPVAAYLDWLDDNAEFARQRHTAQSRELTSQMQHAADLVCASASERLEQVLWQMARELTPPTEQARHARLQLPLPLHELAALIAVTPSTLSRLFNQLEEKGRVQRDNGWLLVPKPGELWRAR